MNINKLILESSDIAKHPITEREREVKNALVQLLVNKNHRKYAERFYRHYDFNIVDSTKHPEFTAAISPDEATIYISDGFLGNGEGIFNQLDVLLRHELAHELMKHQVRMIAEYKEQHKNSADPDKIAKRLSFSVSLHRMMNIIEDFEISNKRYSEEDKRIVKNMMLNGKIIGGLVTEEHREWKHLSLEAMFRELKQEVSQISSDIRNNPYWTPIKDGTYDTIDLIKHETAKLVKKYNNISKPSSIRAPIEVLIKTKSFAAWADIYKSLVTEIYDNLKDLTSDKEKELLLDIVSDVAVTGPLDTFDLLNPVTGELVCTLYTPEDKQLANDVLKNLAGNINYDPMKFKIKRKKNSQKYKNAWNTVINKLDTKKFDDDTLRQLRDAIESM